MMHPVTYAVRAVPIAIARRIVGALRTAQIAATLTPDGDRATIEVPLFDRPALDDLLAPYEAELREKASES
jgi:hypothetical protein